MFLKRLEIRGFKSFADKTELEFPQGITAVVGPNGSGKSNISDAVRWVLGEQSAKSLRGQKMEDIIFAGSDSRKPINFAEVTLVLDNEQQALPIDYSEVAVTRKVYRSGESEYLLNNQTCRLKDIHELFMDTGLGKEAYSIIGQGRIEEVLSSKSEERRGIFEEAAGIVKFKSRKREAEKKLEETELNLVRVHDVMMELEDQIEPLKEASEKAEKFLQLRAELKQLDIALHAHQIEVFDQEWKQFTKEKEILEEQLSSISISSQSREAECTQLKWNLSKCEQLLDQYQSTYTDISTQLEKTIGDKKVLIERKQNIDTNIQQFTSESEQLQFSYDIKLQQIQENEAYIAQTKQQYKQKKSELELQLHVLKNQENDVISKDALLEKMKSDIIDNLQKQATNRNESKYAEQANEKIRVKVEQLQQQSRHLKQQIEELNKQQKSFQEQLHNVTASMATAKEQYSKQKSTLETAQAAYQVSLDEYQQNVQLFHRKKDRQKLLNEMENEYAGYFQGTKEILQTKDRDKALQRDIKGAVVDLIKVPQPYETAIETALGNALQHIVVSDEVTAQKCIQLLKSKARGRATFLPLTIIKGTQRTYPECHGLDGFVGYAAELISYDSMFQGIIHNLLGNVMITKDIKAATEIAKKIGFKCRVVTLDGDYINPGGAMTGGAQQKGTSSLMSRKNEITQLQTELSDLKIRLTEAELENNSKKTHIENQQRELATLLNQIDELRHQEIGFHAEAQKLTQEIQHRTENLSICMEENQLHQADVITNENKIAEIDQLLSQLIQEHQTLELDLQQHQKKLMVELSQKETMSTSITELRIDLAKFEEQLNTLQDNHKRNQEELQELFIRKSKIANSHSDLVHQFGTIDTEMDRLDQMTEHLLREKTRLEQMIQDERVGRKRLQDHVNELEATIANLLEQSKAYDKQIHQLDLKANRCDVELNNALRQLEEEYEISYEKAKKDYPLQEELSVMKPKIKGLKDKIHALGEVNTGAIEEYQRVYERYHFLKYQKEDLQEAINKIYDVIQEMNVEMERRFIESFKLIKDNFSDVFQKMFGGGRASLQLSDPSNILNTGIEIFAEPPGKKLQHLSLLSGGERALTAIALLFAILRVSPVPFCILDEVEAALDEANVSRFANYLRKFSEHTQFIVVTHRKGTMEAADILYGVTMEGSGVSKMISVKLEDAVKMNLTGEQVEAS
ncbi:chromosome segregation protein SMC [Desulfuribacillus stibiiarsenatis]|uniref:Chromosome partition protein Smc n=1 Tax=Desulfuribacillus stibiiarsenatis TaxID=1390249 RepID=A0A1E5L6Z8_9FIRM|nr:chromosome segregation protein SMC [Desulfuribacillus stibiiarsenatis]OEH85784.1 chromosome segregation protein SMC [Desulfuribacillus stibiiarsenatis]